MTITLICMAASSSCNRIILLLTHLTRPPDNPPSDPADRIRRPTARSTSPMSASRCSLVLILVASHGWAADPNPQAKKALDVLKTHCYGCHGDAGNVEGGMN